MVVVEQQRGTKARTCCVGLDVWGVVRWQACLLLHYSVPCVEASHTDTFSAYTPQCEWMLVYSEEPGWVCCSGSHCFCVWCQTPLHRPTPDTFDSSSKVTELLIWVGTVSWLVSFTAAWTCLSYSSQYPAGMSALTCWNRDGKDCEQVWTRRLLRNVPSVRCEKEGEKIRSWTFLLLPRICS